MTMPTNSSCPTAYILSGGSGAVLAFTEHPLISLPQALRSSCSQCKAPLPVSTLTSSPSGLVCVSCAPKGAPMPSAQIYLPPRPIPPPTLVGQPPPASLSSGPTSSFKGTPVPLVSSTLARSGPPANPHRKKRKRPTNILTISASNPRSLVRQPHFNEKGEYLHPEYLPKDSPVFVKVSEAILFVFLTL